MTEALGEQLALLPAYLGGHLRLSLVAIVIGTALSLPLSYLAVRHRSLHGPILAVASAVQTIPGLALLALMVPLLGRIGFLPAVIALILYSILPVLRNTVTGIDSIDPDLIEAGRALGMTPHQLLLRVQAPLALPVIVAGVRTATVWVVGMATLSTPVGATSLGNYIFSGLQTQNYTAVLVGCIAAASLALLLDRGIHVLEILASGQRPGSRSAIAIGLVGAVAAVVATLVISLPSEDRSSAVAIGTKTFTEQYVLGTLIARELEAAGFRTRTLESLGSTVAFDALAAGRIDAYVDYTGTIWANYMGESSNPGREAIAREVEQWLAREHGIDVAARLGFENAYALAMTEARARAGGITTIGDLVDLAPELTIGGDYEFFERPEWASLESRYGLSFAGQVSMDSTLMYQAAARGEVDVISAFSTDGRIAAFDLVLLEDTLGALPPYDAVLLVAPGTRERNPELFRVLARLDGRVSADAMRAANRLVDLDGGSVSAAVDQLIRNSTSPR